MTWKIDSAHSEVLFYVRHMMISTVRGRFNTINGTVDFNEENPVESQVRVEIDAASVDTREKQRDDHLRAPDFLDVEQYPTITFASKRIEQVGDDRGKLIGDLTIHGVTKEVVLDATYAGQAKSPWGTTSAGFGASTEINRKDFGLTYNAALETGGVLVGEKVKIEIELEMIKEA